MMTLVTMTQRKQRGDMRTATENSVEILKWLLICSQDLRGFDCEGSQVMAAHWSIAQIDSNE